MKPAGMAPTRGVDGLDMPDGLGPWALLLHIAGLMLQIRFLETDVAELRARLQAREGGA